MQHFQRDQAVSPVVAVILMVAVTVILSAVIGTFVLNIGNSVEQPQNSVSVRFDETSIGTTVQLVTGTSTPVQVQYRGETIHTFHNSTAGDRVFVPSAPGERITVLTGGTVVATHTMDSPNSLVGYWTMDNTEVIGTILNDLSRYDNDGQIDSNITTGASSDVLGSSFKVNTNGSVTVSKNTSLNHPRGYTISVWFYANSSSSGTEGRHVVQDIGGNNLIQLWSGDKLHFYQEVGGDFYAVHRSYPVTHDEWHHAVMTCKYKQQANTTTCTYYIDAEKKETVSANGTPPGPTGEADFGDVNYVGKLDEFRSYSQVLSESEVNALYELRNSS